MKPNMWIQKTGVKKGKLSVQLGIPEKENIPIGLLEKIRHTEIGEKAKNPSLMGRRSYTVTPLLKKRAVLALTLKKIK
jgi:hypothetical protein